MLFQVGNLATGADTIERREHDCEGLFFTMFALAQTKNRSFIAGVDEQLKTANPLEGHDFSVANFPGRLSKRGIGPRENRA